MSNRKDSVDFSELRPIYSLIAALLSPLQQR